MSRLIGIIRLDGKAPAEATLKQMGEAYEKVSPTFITCQGPVGIGVFDWKGEASAYKDKDGAMLVDGKVRFLEKGSPYSGTTPEILYQTYRREGLLKLFFHNASFSSILLDFKQQQLIVSKDRLGFVPLFMYKDANKIIFASEIKAILAHPEVKVTPSLEAMQLFCLHHYRLPYTQLKTFYNEITMFPPAKSLIFSLKTKTIQWKTNWRFKYQPKSFTEEQAVKEFLQLTHKSASQLFDTGSDKKGFFMSGGLDSTSVISLACQRGERVEAFSAVHPGEKAPEGELDTDESNLMKPLLKQFSQWLNWHPVYPTQEGLLKVLPRLVERYEMPILTITTYPFWSVCEAASKHGLKVMFTGDGPDHLLAGLHEHFWFYFADLKSQGNSELLNREIEYWIKYHDHPMYPKSRTKLEQYFNRCIDFNTPGKITGFSWYHPELVSQYFTASKVPVVKPTSMPPCPTPSYLVNSLWQYIYFTASPCISWFEDIALNSFGLSTRALFHTRELMEFCWNLPPSLMIKDGIFKHLMRVAMKGIVPDDLRNNPVKVGWGAPTNLWFREQLYSPFKEMVTSKDFRSAKLFKPTRLLEILEEHKRGEQNHMMFLWQVFATELWLKRYFPRF